MKITVGSLKPESDVQKYLLLLSGIVFLLVYLPSVYLKIFKAHKFGLAVTSHFKEFVPSGLLSNSEPGWFSELNPTYPQTVLVKFRKAKLKITKIALFPQTEKIERAPGVVKILYTINGRDWLAADTFSNLCSEYKNNGVAFIGLPQATIIKGFKLEIIKNCGDPRFVSLKGVKFS